MTRTVPSVSIIIPIYNSEQCVESCLNSVLSQTFDDWECLLIDDGSTDESGAICDRYVETDGRFKVFHTANSGVSSARNLGIEHAQGRYLAFIDSDDTVAPEYLSALYGAMNDRVELAVCGLKLIRSSGAEDWCEESGAFEINRENGDRFVNLTRLLLVTYVKLYRSDIIKSKSIRFPLGVHFGEDMMFNFSYLENVKRISVIGKAYYNYMIASGGSLSTSPHSRNFTNNYHQWNIIRKFYEKHGIDSQRSREYLSNRLWGIAYDIVMGQKLSLKEIKACFNHRFIEVLSQYDDHTIDIPNWLKRIILKRRHLLIWLSNKVVVYKNR